MSENNRRLLFLFFVVAHPQSILMKYVQNVAFVSRRYGICYFIVYLCRKPVQIIETQQQYYDILRLTSFPMPSNELYCRAKSNRILVIVYGGYMLGSGSGIWHQRFGGNFMTYKFESLFKSIFNKQQQQQQHIQKRRKKVFVETIFSHRFQTEMGKRLSQQRNKDKITRAKKKHTNTPSESNGILFVMHFVSKENHVVKKET